ncbi:hypothetical protein LPW11_04860 [Geomonas sp. RF6]|nr:hypothetical protein [Geomonas sp. RF6]UFS72773.1 hypothetical protein LPW11_04860 [Geomonas sp. RF6]
MNALILLLGSSSSAFAAGGREDHSGLLVWAFLGFCALIVVAQLVPAVLVMLGIAKGMAPQGAQQSASHR